MPRAKGSKNKKSKVVIPANLEEQIEKANAEIEEIGAKLKEKKAALKKLLKVIAEADKQAAEKKLEEDSKVILAALEKSEKSMDEILNFLK